MTKIQFSKIKKITILIALLFFPSFSYASPWAAVGDIGLRNDVEILARYGVISGPVNTWPISWKQITKNLSRTSEMELPAYVRAAAMRVREKVPNEFRIGVRIQATTRPAIIRGFEKTARNDLDGEVIAEYNGDSGTTVHIQGGFRNGNNDNYAHLDGSYISQDFGNWSAYVGAFDRWWGPGEEGTLILSNNARPMPSIGLRRIESKPFNNKWLSWMGPWQWDMYIAKMEKERHIPNVVFAGMRLSFEPIKNFEVGLSRTLQLCGEGRPCGFNSWTKALISIGDLDNPTTDEGRALEPGNQLANMEFSYTFSFSENMSMKLYADGTGDDFQYFIPFKYAKLIGLNIGGPYGSNGSAWKVTAEFSDTLSTHGWIIGTRQPNLIYEHHLYKTGYRYKGSSIGNSLDGDSSLLTISAVFTSYNDWNLGIKYQYAKISRDKQGWKSPVITREIINQVELNASGRTGLGDYNIKVRLHDDKPNSIHEKKFGVDVGMSWSISY